MLPRTSFTALALLSLTLGPAACTSFGAADPGQNASAQAAPGSPGDPDGGGPKAPPVTGTPADETITEEHGFFVAPSGDDKNNGSRAEPFATLGAGITAAASVGKIVYACTGTYNEALVVTDSISIIAGLDCTDPLAWKTGAVPSRIQSPTSPAITAAWISGATRLEGLDVVAPNATTPGASSIGLFADHSPGLTVANSKIAAGNGANGADGAAPIQLTQTSNPAGGASIAPAKQAAPYHSLPGAPGGTSVCAGATGHNGGAGGAGGTGGLYEASYAAGTGYYWATYQGTAPYTPGIAGSGANGHAGDDGDAAPEIGTLTRDGYVPATGHVGGNGSPGSGGGGGTGGYGGDIPGPLASQAAEIDTGLGGPGGGAGGCPGLPGGAGGGGGASIGVALLESPIVLDGVAISSATGGAAGLGAFGGDPTPGGDPGTGHWPALRGGDGGPAGASTNGSSGPSVGILTSGAAPMLTGTTKATPGTGGPAVDARTQPDALGNARTIPAIPAGIAVDVKTL